ncbi:serine hydrolase [Anabaena sp. 4-3]|uniref:serine hydrolase n=1 Tax=Anabaena sp. 4-3 TaxID=1811979 RepID=UPI00083671A7|nr:serine hydrolase [Anabaena sp. 4-3]
MNKNTKIYRKVVKRKTSINYTRFALVCVVPTTTLLILFLLMNKIAQKANNSTNNKQITTSLPDINGSLPTPKSTNNATIQPRINPTISVNKNNANIGQININDNQSEVWEYTANVDTNMRLIPQEDYKQASNNLSKDNKLNSQLIYRVNQQNFKYTSELQTKVNAIVQFVNDKRLPTQHLSVSLIKLNSPVCCEYAGYSDGTPRFPASITKLFWMVYLYGLYEEGYLGKGEVSEKALRKMIQDSDNESASLIVDKITRTKSSAELPPDEYQEWYQKRLALNNFFKAAGYDPINISQKLFPTSYSKNDSPTGADLQIRKDDFYPIRNYTTTRDVARLLLEIEQEKSISSKYSRQMKRLLKRSLKKEDWQNKPFNAIQGFLGEYLPENAYFASKMGWNSKTRNDAAIIASPDGKHKYILVIFGDDPSFYQDKTVLPEISRMLYEQMTQ